MTKLIAAMDERLEAKAPLTAADADALVDQAKKLLVATRLARVSRAL